MKHSCSQGNKDQINRSGGSLPFRLLWSVREARVSAVMMSPWFLRALELTAGTRDVWNVLAACLLVAGNASMEVPEQ